ncbi:axin isoform X1 [Anopheles maculipalpis]|uniref:axin isoform X1 n=1 Tax=Anopheles maculipalpis TaxID=1496333 RepID=UPI002158B31B|nr:axin isoform X1 [Anopheles maculipalpis]
MNQQYFHQKFDDFHSSGPRPPVPGEESRRKMTEASHSDRTRDGSPPAYVRWAQKLAYLLEDGDGAELFKRYVELEGEEPSNRLKFYFACEGLKQQTDSDKVTQLIGAIYRRFLKKAQPGSELYVNESLRNFIKAGLKNELELTPDIFDQMQADVANIIAETTYPHFLQSDLYLQYVQNMQSSSSSSSVIGSGSNCSLAAAVPSTSGGAGSSAAGTSHGGAGGGSSSSGAGAGASCSLTSSSSTSELFLHSSSALPTVHEDAELANADSIEQLYGATGPGLDSHMGLVAPPLVPSSATASSSNTKVPMTLTKDALMATQKRRLEMRPPGPRGYSVYTNYASYNPVSRRDSELASLSSGRTDSDTMSLSSISTDGRPHSQRKHHHHHHSSIERRMMRENALTNEEVDTFSIIPRTHRQTQKQPPPMEFAKILINKLECVAREQEKDEVLCKKMQEAEIADRSQNKVLADAIRQKLQVDDDNDQDILDQHVSRVWSDLTPSRSPGTMSPCPPNVIGSRSRRLELAGFGAQSSMRHSKSMPEGHPLMGPPMQPPMPMQMSSGSRKLNNKWPSINTDSGISLFSTDTLTKHGSSGGGSRGELSLGSSSRPLSRNMHDMHTATLLQESSRRLEDETRRSKRYQYPPSAIQNMPLPPVPMSSNSGGFSSNLPPAMPPPPIPAKPLQAPNEFTIVVYSFCDEEVPYRIKIPGTQPPTLRQFKDYLPKKGNYRFFFKTRCEDLDNPVIQEEVNSDSEPLPLFEGKVMGTVKPSE